MTDDEADSVRKHGQELVGIVADLANGIAGCAADDGFGVILTLVAPIGDGARVLTYSSLDPLTAHQVFKHMVARGPGGYVGLKREVTQ